MAFVEKTQSSGKDREFLTASSTTIAKGDALVFSSGYLTPAAATDTSACPIVIASEAVTTGSGDHKKILGIVADSTMEFEVDTATQLVQANVGASVKFGESAGVITATSGGPVKVIAFLPGKKAIVKIY